MAEFIQTETFFTQLRPLRTSVLVSLLLSSSLWLLVLVFFIPLPPQIPLFYSRALAEQYLAHKLWFFILPTTSLAISLFHLFINRYLLSIDILLARLFAWTTVVVQILVAISIIRIIVVVT